MKDSKLVDLLSDMTAEDFRQLQKMLQSPFFTSNKNLLALYKLLRSVHPDYTYAKLEKQKVFKKIFPKHEYSDIKLRNLNSDLVRIIEDYLIQKEMKLNVFERKKLLLKIYKNKKRLDWFSRELKKLDDDIDRIPYRDPIYYKQKMDLKLLQLEYFERSKPKSRFGLLEEWEDLLDDFYLLSKARHKVALKNFKKLLTPSSGKDEVDIQKDNVLLKLYKQFDQLNETEDLDLFEEIKKKFKENILLIRPELQRELLNALINFAIKQMIIDDEKYNTVVLDLYKLGLKQQIIFNTNQISDTAFFNIVVSGSKAKEFEWTKSFINDYENHLSKDSKTDIKTISLSTFYLHKKEFSKAIDLIKSTTFNQFQVNSVARMHALRCYYELFLLDSTFFDLLVAQIDSNERFVRRSTDLPETIIRSRLNFLNFMKKLIKTRAAGKLKPSRQEMMKKELLNQEITLSRSWLIDIIKR